MKHYVQSQRLFLHEALLFNKGIYFMKQCVIIYSIYFEERFTETSIPKMQGSLTPGKKQKMI